MMNKKAKIYVAGHQGLVGSALMRELQEQDFTNIVTRTPQQLDLRSQADVHYFFATEKPDYVFLAAAKVGGIKANNDQPAAFMYDNVMINTNVIHAAYKYGVTKLLFLGSSCIYPRDCAQPIKEDYLLTGPLEETNKAYAVAKIAGIQLCQAYNTQYKTNFIAAMPTNLYGPGDTFDVARSHVIPALITKFHKAKQENKNQVVLWGTGKPRREFLHVDDCAQALVHLMHNYRSNEIINVGTGVDISIAELGLLIKEVVGFTGNIVFDSNYPDGTPQKLLNIKKITELGWQANIDLKKGLEKTYDWFLLHGPSQQHSFFSAKRYDS